MRWELSRLAQTAGSEGLLTEALPWSLAVLAVVVVLLVVVSYYRRRLRAGDSGGGEPWSLQDLREMHARGDLSDAEFERLKAGVIAEQR